VKWRRRPTDLRAMTSGVARRRRATATPSRRGSSRRPRPSVWRIQLADQNIRANTVTPGNTYFEGGVWQRRDRRPGLFEIAVNLNPTGHMAPGGGRRAGGLLASPAVSGTNPSSTAR
jgi:hypothetical protein